MSRSTPETDEFSKKQYIRMGVSSNNAVDLLIDALEKTENHARKLERERDEAREKYDNLATEHMLAINKLCNERDEAREMAQQLIHIASHCLGWHDNSNPETITEAINRWNASTKK